MGLTTLFNNSTGSEMAPVANYANPRERRAELEEVLSEHATLLGAVAEAQKTFESYDQFLRDRYLNGTGAAVTEDSVAEQRRSDLRKELAEAQLALANFEKEHNVAAVETEMADIQANADARERAAARQEVIEMMAEFDRDVLRAAEARWAEIRQRLIDVENRWPGQRVVIDMPHVPDGIFFPDATRSILTWFREKLCAAQPDLFDKEDPVRARIDAMRAQGKIVIWDPSRPMWG